jgi:hypothetical protein
MISWHWLKMTLKRRRLRQTTTPTRNRMTRIRMTRLRTAIADIQVRVTQLGGARARLAHIRRTLAPLAAPHTVVAASARARLMVIQTIHLRLHHRPRHRLHRHRLQRLRRHQRRLRLPLLRHQLRNRPLPPRQLRNHHLLHRRPPLHHRPLRRHLLQSQGMGAFAGVDELLRARRRVVPLRQNWLVVDSCRQRRPQWLSIFLPSLRSLSKSAHSLHAFSYWDPVAPGLLSTPTL